MSAEQEALERAYVNCDRIRPLEPGTVGQEFHVDLKRESLEQLFLDLRLMAGENIKILFSGHQGCGKSTQLNYLAAEADIRERFLVVKYSIQELLNPTDLDHIDLLLSMVLKAYEAAEEAGGAVSEELKEQAQKFADQLHGLIQIETTEQSGRSGATGVTGSVGVPSLLDFIKAQFFARYQLDEAIFMSGGVMRELMGMIAKSIQYALLSNKSKVSRDDVDRAVIAIRNGFPLRADHIDMLKTVLQDPYWYPESRVEDPESPFLELLHTLALLEYRNGEDKWRRPHPVLRKLLER